LSRWLGAALQPILESPLAAPSRRQIDHLAARGQQEVQRWIERGRSEEQRSRAVASLAFDETVDAFLEYLTQNPEVKDLVQSQSTGLANEVLEEARARAVSVAGKYAGNISCTGVNCLNSVTFPPIGRASLTSRFQNVDTQY
jgi:hypothetical protein